MEKLELYQYVALSKNVLEYNLKQGDVAMLIDYVTHPNDGEDGYVLEVFNAAVDSLVFASAGLRDFVRRNISIGAFGINFHRFFELRKLFHFSHCRNTFYNW